MFTHFDLCMSSLLVLEMWALYSWSLILSFWSILISSKQANIKYIAIPYRVLCLDQFLHHKSPAYLSSSKGSFKINDWTNTDA